MKKLTLTFAIVLGMTLGALAQNNSSTLFQNSNDGDSQSLFEYLQDLFETEEDATEAFAIENVGGGMLGGGGMFQRGAIGGGTNAVQQQSRRHPQPALRPRCNQ